MTSLLERRRTFAPMAVVAAIAIVGCSRATDAPRTAASKPAVPAGHEHDATDHDHDHDDHEHDHDHPRTLGESVGKLAALAASVKQHLAAEARDEADEAVHDLGHVLEDLQEFVRTSDVAVDAKAAATKALDELFECFMALDESLHAEPGQGKPPAEVHASVATRIEAAIEELEAAVKDDAAAIIRGAQESSGKDDK